MLLLVEVLRKPGIEDAYRSELIGKRLVHQCPAIIPHPR